eukprot:scaffold3.g6446.t1
MEALVSAARKLGPEGMASLLEVVRSPSEIDRLGPTGQNALHLAVWRNHSGLVSVLLDAGADPNLRDAESGWAALHHALYYGHLRLAPALLAADAAPGLPDCRGAGPVDLLSAELRQFLGPGPGDVFSWGSGSNYTLGTGSTDVELHPTRLEGLHDAQAALLSAAKFHSAAVTAEGALYTWGWGRGGRLGHPEAHVHSGESAVIAPRLVAALGRRAVAAVAAAKHHTVLCTTVGEVFTFGSNRYGQLGTNAVDTQPVPRRLATLRQRVVAVAAANKHSVAVSAGGEVFTWGGNAVGQLGYGSVDSTSNAAPRLVEAMKGRRVVAAAAAKRHTLVLTAEGEVYTWGHRGVSPRRVLLAGARDSATLAGEPLRFHRGHADVVRPLAADVCAGAAHSAALTTAGVVLCWRSADPALQVQEVRGPLAGQRCVSVSAGKYRTAAVTEQGDVYMWEGRSDYFPAEGRQPGSGSKKGHGSRAGRPIPPRMSGHTADGGGGGGSCGEGTPGSYGSHNRRPGSHFERFVAEREAGADWAGPSSLGGARGATPPSARSTPAKGAGAGDDAFAPIVAERVEGLKRVVHVAVGEKHSLAVQRWAAAQLAGLPHIPWLDDDVHAAPPAADEGALYARAADGEDGSQLATPRSTGDLSAEPSGAESAPGSPLLYSPIRPGRRRRPTAPGDVGAPSLQRMCEEVVARHLVEPRTALQVLEYADVAGASMLRAYCLSVALCNLDAVLVEARGAFEELAPHLLDELERLWKLRLAGAEAGGEAADAEEATARERGAAPEPAGNPELEEEAARGASAGAAPYAGAAVAARQGSVLQPGRRPTAAPPELGEGGGAALGGLTAASSSPASLGIALGPGGSSFRREAEVQSEAAAGRLLRTLQKKLQQIGSLEERAAAGAALDPQQRAKLAQGPVLHAAAQALQSGMAVEDVHSILRVGAVGEDEASAGAPASAGAAGKDGGKASASKAKPKGSAKKGGAAPSRQAISSADAELPAQLSGLSLAEAGASEAAEAPAPPAEQAAAMLGSSPPASVLVPAFGLGDGAPRPRPSTEAGEPMSPVTTQVGFAARSGVLAAAAADRPRSSSMARDSAGKAKRKGGLSMFLRGDLDASTPPPAAAAPPAAPASASPAGPAWGGRGAAAPPAPTSLRDILERESASAPLAPTPVPRASGSSGGARTPASAGKHTGRTPNSAARPAATEASPAVPGAGPTRMSLSSFMQQSSPLSIQQQQQQQHKGPAAAGPAWGGVAGASPPARGPSLLEIQQQQRRAAEAAAPPPRAPHGSSPPASRRVAAGLPAWRPLEPGGGGAAAAAAAAPPPLGTSPTGTSLVLGTSPSGGRGAGFAAAPALQQSKWYLPDEKKAAQKSLAAIQTEEQAVVELAKRYGSGNVRVVTRQARPPGLPARPQVQQPQPPQSAQPQESQQRP